MKSPANSRIVWTAEQVQAGVSEMAAKLSETMAPGSLFCLVLMRGGFFFGADLVRQLRGFDHLEIDMLRLSSYAGMKSSGKISFKGQMPKVAGKRVLVIEDLLDTGLTLSSVRDALSAAGAASVTYAVLVDKRAHREFEVKPDFAAFTIDSGDFLFGYGMDIDGLYRELPYIGAVARSV